VGEDLPIVSSEACLVKLFWLGEIPLFIYHYPFRSSSVVKSSVLFLENFLVVLLSVSLVSLVCVVILLQSSWNPNSVFIISPVFDSCMDIEGFGGVEDSEAGKMKPKPSELKERLEKRAQFEETTEIFAKASKLDEFGGQLGMYALTWNTRSRFIKVVDGLFRQVSERKSLPITALIPFIFGLVESDLCQYEKIVERLKSQNTPDKMKC
jgi:hypothetical protein